MNDEPLGPRMRAVTPVVARKVAPMVAPMAALLLASPGSSAAAPAPSPFKVQASLGFGGAYRVGAWNTITVKVQNDGPAFRGRLVFRDAPDGDAAIEYLRHVELPSHSRKA